MKYLICTVQMLFCTGLIAGQQHADISFAPAYRAISGPELNLEFTLGELHTSWMSASTFHLSPGFLQPSRPVSTSARSAEIVGLEIFPNPTADRLTVRSARNGHLAMRLSTLQGIELFATTIRLPWHYSLNHLPAGAYLLTLEDKSGAVAHCQIVRP